MEEARRLSTAVMGVDVGIGRKGLHFEGGEPKVADGPEVMDVPLALENMGSLVPLVVETPATKETRPGPLGRLASVVGKSS